MTVMMMTTTMVTVMMMMTTMVTMMMMMMMMTENINSKNSMPKKAGHIEGLKPHDISLQIDVNKSSEKSSYI